MLNLEWLNEAIEDVHTALLEDTNLPFDTVLDREVRKIRNRILEEHNKMLLALRKEIEMSISKRIKG